MTGRGTLIGICVVCALALSGLAAQSAAATTGTTAFTCVKGAASAFSDSHCRFPGFGSYGHVEIAESTQTLVSGFGGEARLKGTISGINFEVRSASASTTGFIENRLAGGEHYASGLAVIVLASPTVAAPAGKGCAISEEFIETKQLSLTTKGQGDGLKIARPTGEILDEFAVTGCSGSKALEALNGVYSLTGSVVGIPGGATTDFTHAGTTEQGTLKLRGQKAGLEVSLALSGDNPISFTTVTT